MAGKKSKHMTGVAFPIQVCDAIRHHIGEGKVLESKRVIAFEDRDAAIDQMGEMKEHTSPEYLEQCKRHSEAILTIERLSSGVKWHRNQVTDLVERADQPELDFMYEPPAEPKVRHPKLPGLDGAEGGPAPKGKDGGTTGAGNQSVDILIDAGVPDRVVAKVKNAGYLTVGALANRRDGEAGTMGRLTALCGISPVDEQLVENALENLAAHAAEAAKAGVVGKAPESNGEAPAPKKRGRPRKVPVEA